MYMYSPLKGSWATLSHRCKRDFVYTFTGWDKLYRNYLGWQKQHKKAFSQETRFILHSLQHFLWLLRLRRLLFWWHGTNDVRVTRISNAENWHTEVLATSCPQFDVVAGVMMDSSLGQHGIVLNLTFSVNRHKENYHWIALTPWSCCSSTIFRRIWKLRILALVTII